MSELIVFAFPDEKGASEMDEAIQRLKKEQLITLDDAAVVVRNHDGKVKVKQASKPCRCRYGWWSILGYADRTAFLDALVGPGNRCHYRCNFR